MSEEEDAERRMCHAQAMAGMFTRLLPEGLRLEWERQEPVNLYNTGLPQWPDPPYEPMRKAPGGIVVYRGCAETA